MKQLKVAGFDMGEDYVAWAVMRGSLDDGFELYRHGLLYPPDLGSTTDFGITLPTWASFFRTFIEVDIRPNAIGVERFTYRPGGTGQGAEAINLRIPGMVLDMHTYLVRNTEWKSWFKRNLDEEGAPHHFRLPTTHESDAAGIALYTASVCLRRRVYFSR